MTWTEIINNQIEHQIIEAEEKLRLAMLHSNVEALDRMLSSRLMFTDQYVSVKEF